MQGLLLENFIAKLHIIENRNSMKTRENIILLFLKNVTAHLFCHPKVNAFCHAGTRSVKMEALHLVRTLSYFVKAADASGKTKAITPTCAAAQEKMETVSSRLQIHREDTVCVCQPQSVPRAD